MSTTPTFGHWLRRRRKAIGLTQKALALAAGCAEVTLRKIEAGDLQPSALLVASLGEALAVDDADLPTLISLARGLEDDFTTKARLLRPQRPNNLPAQLTPLIGRSRDITAVRRRLLADGARLVTLLGPPGVGKTRLSLAVAEDVLEQFNDGVFFIRLAPVSDPDQVAAAIAQALGLQMSGPNPPELQLRAYLEEKHLLLVLDNFEQIVAAAPLVDDLLRRCPWLHVLVTSRQPLRVRGERQVTVQPLALPAVATASTVASAEDMLRYPAVEFFADRAEAVLPDFAVDDGNAAAVAELCRRLDGLPLAIELVAARVKLLPPAALLQRMQGPWLLSTDGLRDVSARQKTLRGAIGWSYDLLSPAEQTLFMYLSVFVGGFTLEVAELLCCDALSPVLPLTFSPAQVLDGIGSLLDKNLLHRDTGMYGEPRYLMLETVREYGLERVDVCDRKVVLQERQARCLMQLVEDADRREINPRKLQLNRLIDADIMNLRAAMAWCIQQDVQAALTLAAHLLHWYRQRGPMTEARILIDAVFSLPGASAPSIPRARALLKAGDVMWADGEDGAGKAFLEESLNLSQRLGDIKGVADALHYLGWHELARSRESEATVRNQLESALALYRELGDFGGIAFAAVVLGQEVFYRELDYAYAQALAEESIAAAQQGSFPFHWPFILFSDICWAKGDLTHARSLMDQGLAGLRESREGIPLIASFLENAAAIAIQQGDLRAAHGMLEEALALRTEVGSLNSLGFHNLHSGQLFQAKGDYGRAIRYYRASLPGISNIQAIWTGCLLSLTELAASLGCYQLAAKLLGATWTVGQTRQRLFPVEQMNYNRLEAATKAVLGATAYDTAWMTGRESEFEEAVEEALAILEATLAR